MFNSNEKAFKYEITLFSITGAIYTIVRDTLHDIDVLLEACLKNGTKGYIIKRIDKRQKKDS